MATANALDSQVTAAQLAELADLPYFRVDAHRNVVELSPAMERLTGFAANEVIGRSCLRVHRCEECLRGCGVFENLHVADQRLELYRADGSTVSVRKSGRVLIDEAGDVAGAIEVVRRLDADGPTGVSDAVADPALQSEEREVAEIRHALQRARYRRTDAAHALGMSRTTLWRKMREYGL